MLQVNNLSFSYGTKSVLKDVSLSLENGETATLIGSSGSGKSTLFKVLTGMLPLQRGSIAIQNLTWPAGQSQLAYMMQEDLLLPWRTVLGNITLVTELGPTPHSRPMALKEAKALLSELGLAGCHDLYPDQLSGGMRQRVAMARALLLKRNLLLLDEPFGSLDVALREQMYLTLRDLQKKHRMTTLMVTHDFRDAITLSDRIFHIHEGVISKEWKITQETRENLLAKARLTEELHTAMALGLKSIS